jgi:hypothetical protein
MIKRCSMKAKLLISILLASVLLTGCINFDVYQKIKRNGLVDISLTVSTVPEYKSLISGINQSLEVEDSVKDRFKFTENDTALKYEFTDIDFNKDKKLFKDVVQNQSQDSPAPTQNSSLFNPENVKFTKDFRFPFYEYTYINKVKQQEQNDTNVSDEMKAQLSQIFKITYTVEVFGTVTETNGVKIASNKVRFDLVTGKSQEYMVKFRDFFLAALMGDSYTAFLWVLGIIIVGFVVFFAAKKLRSRPITPPEPINQQLLDYVRASRMRGMQDAQIALALQNSGWPKREIEKVMKK